MFNTFRIHALIASIDAQNRERRRNRRRQQSEYHDPGNETEPDLLPAASSSKPAAMAPSSSSKPFSRYLVPSLPLTLFRRRRRSSTSSSTSTTSSLSPPSTPSSHQTLLRCLSCGLDLCLSSQIISKGFTGRHGRAYLVRPSTASTTSPSPSRSLPNTYAGPAVPRQLVTGAHTVSDLACVGCRSVLGWRYVAAEEESQRYKVGMCILETRRVCGGVWTGEEELAGRRGEERWVDDDDAEENVEFDSQDEDECEDLFAGLWSAKTAVARRRRKERRATGGGGGGGGE